MSSRINILIFKVFRKDKLGGIDWLCMVQNIPSLYRKGLKKNIYICSEFCSLLCECIQLRGRVQPTRSPARRWEIFPGDCWNREVRSHHPDIPTQWWLESERDDETQLLAAPVYICPRSSPADRSLSASSTWQTIMTCQCSENIFPLGVTQGFSRVCHTEKRI